ncbi:MAG: hypothetical protein ABI592_08130 [Acidobacteriota bacterium]
MSTRPSYKSHPLWNEAMALTKEVYALADRLAPLDADLARRLKKLAVTVPAGVAGAAATGGEERLGHVAAARAALGELSREALALDAAVPADAEGVRADAGIARRADSLHRAILFEFGAQGGLS